MFRGSAHRWPSVIKSSPVLPLATTSWSRDYASEKKGEDLAPPSSGQKTPDGDSEEVHATPSPLTYGKVFGAGHQHSNNKPEDISGIWPSCPE